MKKLILAMLLLVSSFSLTACGSSKEEVDVLKYLNVTFSGENGEGKANGSISSMGLMTDEKLQNYTQLNATIAVTFDKSTNLKNGDKVKAKITYNENYYGDADIKFEETEKEFEVNGLIEYYSAKNPISKAEYKELQDYVFKEAIIEGGIGTYDKYVKNEDGTITNRGVTMNITFDSMYIAEGCKNLHAAMNPVKDNSLIAFYKVEYSVDSNFYYYDKLKPEELKGTYYLWAELVDLAIKPDTKERYYNDDNAPESQLSLGQSYIEYKWRFSDGTLEKKANDEIGFAYMSKEEMLEYFANDRQGEYKEIQVK